MKMKQSEDERLLLEELRAEGFEVTSLVQWLVRRPETYAGAEELLVKNLESCGDERLAGTLATLLRRRGFRPALPVLIAKLGQVRGRGTELQIAQAIARLGVEGHEDAVLAAAREARTVAARRLLHRALRKAGVEPPLRGYMATEERILGGFLAAVLAIVGGLALGLSPVIVDRAGWLVLPPAVVAGSPPSFSPSRSGNGRVA